MNRLQELNTAELAEVEGGVAPIILFGAGFLVGLALVGACVVIAKNV